MRHLRHHVHARLREVDEPARRVRGQVPVRVRIAMAKVSDSVLREVERALADYKSDVRTAGLKPSAQETYILHADHFVRWLRDDFTPGDRKA